MISHEQIKLSVALAVANSQEIAAYCRENFGETLNVIVNRYGQDGFPGESDAPFCYIYSDGENEMGDVDEESFEFVIIVGGVDDGESPRRRTVIEATDETSGLVVCGIADKIETVRGMIEEIVRKSVHGAIFRTCARTESNLCDYPLEWAKLRVNYSEPETLG